MRNFIVMLLILGALYGGYKIYSERAAAERLARNPWSARMTPLIRAHTSKQILAGSGASGDAGYYTILYLAWQAAESGYSDLESVKRAATAAGADSGEATRIAAAVHENVMFAKSMGVFTDPNNPIRMERGEPPVSHAEGWEDELLVTGHLLSPLLAPEAAYALPNLRLMPEVVRDMATARVTKATADLARKWAADKIISPETAKAISELLAEQRGK